MKNEIGQELHEKLCAYVLGEGSAFERAQMERELANSAELRAEKAQLEATIGLVRGAFVPSETLSADANAALAQAAAPRMASARHWSSGPWLRIAAGVMAFGVAYGTLRMTSRGELDTQVARLDGERASGASELAFEAEPFSRAAKEQEQKARELALVMSESGAVGDPVNAKQGDATIAEGEQRAIGIGLSSAVDRRAPSPEEVAAALHRESVTHRGSGASPAQMGAPSRLSTPSKSQATLAEEANAAMAGAASSLPSIAQGADAAGRDDLTNDAWLGAKKRDVSNQVDPQVAATSSVVAKRPETQATPALPSPLEGLKFGVVPKDQAGGNGAPIHPNVQTSSSDTRKLDAPTANGRLASSGPSIAGASGPSTGGPAGPSSPAPGNPVAGAQVEPHKRGTAYTVDVHGRAGQVSKGDDEAKVALESARQKLAELGYADGDASKRAELEAKLEGFLDRQGAARGDDASLSLEARVERETRRILDGCIRRPNERPRDMFFRFWGDNPFEVAALDPLSTFSIDVDTASYTLARRYLMQGTLPEKAQIRTEEFVNYFKTDVPAPTDGATFRVRTDLAPSRFSADAGRQMLRVTVKGKEIAKEERKPLVLSFVIDVSGSMKEQNRLETVKHCMRMLATQLDANDRFGIVSFSTDAKVVLATTAASNRVAIEEAIQSMQPDGSTNSNAGLQLGYAMALQALDSNATNRVVFLSDGVANVGETDPAKISEGVRSIREKGIYLNTIGVGMNNHNDVLLEQLADKSDGVCNYVDDEKEAKRVLVEGFTGAFQPIARDVKIQVEFDPAQVLRYRLLGYENRAIADADFRNDKVDAGEVGAGQSVTALYEIETANGASEKPLATVRLRWKAPKSAGASEELDRVSEQGFPVQASSRTSFEGAGAGYRKHVIAAQFAEILRRSIHARGDSLDALVVEGDRLLRETPDDADLAELVTLMKTSRELVVRSQPACDELCQAVDAIREHQYLRAQLETVQREQDQQTLDLLAKQNQELEARLRDLIRRRAEGR